jgi:hypothetical protein
MYRRSNFDVVGTAGEPDILYYNADIINNDSTDLSYAEDLPDPNIEFVESRDAPLIKDASKYEFSIVRFNVNGANRDLPLFIPSIQLGLTQTDPNLTVYGAAISFSQQFETAPGVFNIITITPPVRFVDYTPETLNARLAPVPPAPSQFGGRQNISTRYYWVYTYEHWLDLVNQTLVACVLDIYPQLTLALAAYGVGNPYATPADLLAACNAPKIRYDPTTNLFTIDFDSQAYGVRLVPFTATPYNAVGPVAGIAASPQCRLFFNSNMYGLFANFPNRYYNTQDIFALGGPVFWNGSFQTVNPIGYVNEVLVVNKNYTNVTDYRQPPYGGVPPAGFVPAAQRTVYWNMTQDFPSSDSLWTPISSLVFCTSLLPVRTEYVGPPNLLGKGNLGESSASVPNAFQPIITDIAVDLGSDANGAGAYRRFITYNPTAEYRMADLSTSQQEVRAIDVRVYWKNRLTSELIPMTMFNLSSVNIKIMFRRKGLYGGKTGQI